VTNICEWPYSVACRKLSNSLSSYNRAVAGFCHPSCTCPSAAFRRFTGGHVELTTAVQVAIGTTFAVKALGVSSVEEFRDAIRGFGDPMAQSLQEALLPVKARIQVSLSDFLTCPDKRLQTKSLNKHGVLSVCLELSMKPVSCASRRNTHARMLSRARLTVCRAFWG
jgi:hypothetical protein